MKTDTKQAPSRTGFEQKSEFSNSDGEQDEIKRKVEAAGKPGPAHKSLDALVGDWKAEVKCWMQPGEGPHVSRGTARATWKFKGRFIEEDFDGEMMGQPFSGRTLLGFDNTKQTFNSVWVSDTQTSMFTSEGKGDKDNKVITLEGKASCAATGRKDVPMRTVLRFLGPDKHVLEMYDQSRGEHAKTMEITYTRE
jgi:hypothetical protein